MIKPAPRRKPEARDALAEAADPAAFVDEAGKVDDLYPWEQAQLPRGWNHTFNVRLPMGLFLRLEWLAARSPDSMHKIALAGIAKEIQNRLLDLGVPEKSAKFRLPAK